MHKPAIRVLLVLALALGAVAFAQIQTGQASPDQVRRALEEAPGPWASEAIELVVSQGLYIGYPDGSFGWRNEITRAEFAVVLARLISVYGLDRFDADELDVLQNAVDELRGELGQLGDIPATLEAHEQELAELRDAIAALESMGMAFEQADVSADAQQLSDRLTAVEAALDEIRASLSAQPVEPAPAPSGEPADPTALAGLEERLAALESERAGLGDETAALRAAQQSLEARLAQLEERAQNGGGEVVAPPPAVDTSATAGLDELRGRVEQLESRLQSVEDELTVVRGEIDRHAERVRRIEQSLLPDRAAFYVNVAMFGTDPDFDLFAKATLGHDSLIGAVGARVSFEYSLGAAPHNVSAALTYRTSFGSTDGYFGLGGGVTLDDPMAPFGEILAGVNLRVARNLGMYFEGRYRPFFDGGTTPASSGFGAGLSLRF